MTRHIVVLVLLAAACAAPTATVEQAVLVDGDELFAPDRECVHAFNPSAHCSIVDGTRCMEQVAGDSGFSVQKFFDVHCETLGACGSGPGTVGPGSIDALRLCGEPDADSPCGPTGPKGCAVCGPVHITCD